MQIERWWDVNHWNEIMSHILHLHVTPNHHPTLNPKLRGVFPSVSEKCDPDITNEFHSKIGVLLFACLLKTIFIINDILTRVTHICISKLCIIGSDIVLSPKRHQASIWFKDGILLIGPWEQTSAKILMEISTFSFKKMHMEFSSGNGWPFYTEPNVLMAVVRVGIVNPPWWVKAPGIPGACAIRNFAYLARAPWWISTICNVAMYGPKCKLHTIKLV